VKVPEGGAPNSDSSKSNGPLSVSSAAKRSEKKRVPRDLGRHLEGWPLLAVAVSISLFGVILAVPRPQPPEEVPAPEVDRREQRRSLEAEASLADAAEREPLPFEVRAVGEALRRHGVGEGATSGPQPALEQLAELRSLARTARAKHGDLALLRLRAAQSRLFRRALERWEASGSLELDLNELGGGFLTKARRSAWIEDDRKLVLDEAERDVVFRLRWAELVGLSKEHPFRATLNDWRTYYRLLIEHPDVSPQEGRASRRRAQLRYVQALQRLDPEFPADLAIGVLTYQLGDYAQAVSSFQAHLAAHPAGPWRLRVQNHLTAAQKALSESSF
jgi:hypothetical protein